MFMLFKTDDSCDLVLIFSFSILVFAKGVTRGIYFSLFGFFGHNGTELATHLQSRTWVSVSSFWYVLEIHFDGLYL